MYVNDMIFAVVLGKGFVSKPILPVEGLSHIRITPHRDSQVGSGGTETIPLLRNHGAGQCLEVHHS